jgi:DNA-binding protein WhiA
MSKIKDALWDEWGEFPIPKHPEDEITGIIDGLPVTVKNGEYIFRCGRLFAVKRLLGLWKRTKFAKVVPASADLRLVYKSTRVLYGFAMKSEVAEKIFSRSLSYTRRSRNWQWCRGLWGACGALYIPKSGYYLVLRPPNRNGTADRMSAIMRSAGFSLGVRTKNGTPELMLRDQQHIATFLSRLGFSHTVLLLEEAAIYRSLRNRANKLVNCDSANINKSVEAARAQLELIGRLENAGAVAELPTPLKDVIFARKNNPSASLRELGQSLPIPISKSTVEYRLRKLETIMQTIDEGDGGHVFRKVRR